MIGVEPVSRFQGSVTKFISTVQIDITSDERTHLYLIEGLFTGGDDWEWSKGSRSGERTTRITAEDLAPGSYTVAATTRDRNTTGNYQLRLSLGSTTKKPKPTTASTSTPTLPPKPKVCEPLTNFSAYRTSATWVYGSWTNPTTGLTATNKNVDIQRKQGANWVQRPVINQRGAAYTHVWHIGADRNTEYRYRVRNECGTSHSAYTAWVTVPPYRSGLSGQSGSDAPVPTPTPVPNDSGG